MVEYKLLDIFGGDKEKGRILFENAEFEIRFGILEQGDYLICKGSRNYKINKNDISLRGLLPLLQIDALRLKDNIEEKGVNFFEVIPIEKILLTAFDDRFSLF